MKRKRYNLRNVPGRNTKRRKLMNGVNGVENENEIVCSFENIFFTEYDLFSLGTEEWISDNVIDFYIKKYCNTLGREEIHVFNSQFFKLLERDIGRAARTVPSIDIRVFEKKLLFIPYNPGNHWSLFVVCNIPEKAPKSKNSDRTIAMGCDSLAMTGSDPRYPMNLIRDYLNRRLGVEIKTELRDGGNVLHTKFCPDTEIPRSLLIPKDTISQDLSQTSKDEDEDDDEEEEEEVEGEGEEEIEGKKKEDQDQEEEEPIASPPNLQFSPEKFINCLDSPLNGAPNLDDQSVFDFEQTVPNLLRSIEENEEEEEEILDLNVLNDDIDEEEETEENIIQPPPHPKNGSFNRDINMIKKDPQNQKVVPSPPTNDREEESVEEKKKTKKRGRGRPRRIRVDEKEEEIIVGVNSSNNNNTRIILPPPPPLTTTTTLPLPQQKNNVNDRKVRLLRRRARKHLQDPQKNEHNTVSPQVSFENEKQQQQKGQQDLAVPPPPPPVPFESQTNQQQQQQPSPLLSSSVPNNVFRPVSTSNSTPTTTASSSSQQQLQEGEEELIPKYFDSKTLPFLRASLPIQENGYDCGLYLIEYLRQFVVEDLTIAKFPYRNRRLFKKEIIPVLRKKLKDELNILKEQQKGKHLPLQNRRKRRKKKNLKMRKKGKEVEEKEEEEEELINNNNEEDLRNDIPLPPPSQQLEEIEETMSVELPKFDDVVIPDPDSHQEEDVGTPLEPFISRESEEKLNSQASTPFAQELLSKLTTGLSDKDDDDDEEEEEEEYVSSGEDSDVVIIGSNIPFGQELNNNNNNRMLLVSSNPFADFGYHLDQDDDGRRDNPNDGDFDPTLHDDEDEDEIANTEEMRKKEKRKRQIKAAAQRRKKKKKEEEEKKKKKEEAEKKKRQRQRQKRKRKKPPKPKKKKKPAKRKKKKKKEEEEEYESEEYEYEDSDDEESEEEEEEEESDDEEEDEDEDDDEESEEEEDSEEEEEEEEDIVEKPKRKRKKKPKPKPKSKPKSKRKPKSKKRNDPLISQMKIPEQYTRRNPRRNTPRGKKKNRDDDDEGF